MQPTFLIEVLARKAQIKHHRVTIQIRIFIYQGFTKGAVVGLPYHGGGFIGKCLGCAQVVIVDVVQLTLGVVAVINHRERLIVKVCNDPAKTAHLRC